ncbi:Chemotaxis protein [Pseudomonas coronafaciens pv. coronafaciens]|nr:Chemotaxis protein [Pseudomonas coronafaciens pv. coronafaciens]
MPGKGSFFRTDIMFDKLSISQKLYFSFTVIVVFIAALVASSYRGFGQVEDATDYNTIMSIVIRFLPRHSRHLSSL